MKTLKTWAAAPAMAALTGAAQSLVEVTMQTRFLAMALVATSMSAQAVEVDISAGPTGWGCTTCYGGFNNSDVAPGTTVALVNAGESVPLQLRLAAGTYTITNAQTSGAFSAWNFEGYPSSPNWAWSYIVGADNGDGTATIVQTGGVLGIADTQADEAGLTGTNTASYQTLLSGTTTAGYTNTLTLTTATTLDFFIDDGFLADNGGGVALNIEPQTSAVPETANAALLLAGVGMVYWLSRRALRTLARDAAQSRRHGLHRNGG